MIVDWSILIEGDTPTMIAGALLTTIQLAVLSLLVALLLGLLFAVARLGAPRIVAGAVTAVVDFLRSTPPIVQLLFWYFGAAIIFPGPLYAWLKSFGLQFTVAVLGLGLYTSAFVAEVIRSGVESLPKGQREAALSVGLSTTQAIRYVILPQVFRIVVLPMINEFLSLTKNTSLAVGIGVAELSYIAMTLQAQTFHTVEIFTAVTLMYLVLALAITYTSKLVARRLNLGLPAR